MSRQLPQKPNLEYLKKQAKELLRSMGQCKLADAQHTLANEYGFATWAKLKSHVETLGLSPAEALKAAVCESDAPRVRELLERYPELRVKIDDPLPNDGFGQHALFAAVQRSDCSTIDVLLRAGADIRKRTEWWAGGLRRARRLRSELGGVSNRTRSSAGCALGCAAGNAAATERAGNRRSRPRARKRWRRTDTAALRIDGRGCEVPFRQRRRDGRERCGSRIDAGSIYAARRSEAALSEGPAGCSSLPGVPWMPYGHLDGRGTRRYGTRTAAPGHRSRLHPDECFGGMVS
jgi:hypothetical protein